MPVAGVVLLVLLALGALVARSAALAARDLQQARSGLQAARDGSPDIAQLGEAVEQAQALLRRADTRLSAPTVRVVAAVPLLGRSLNAERAVVKATGSALAGVRAVVDAGPQIGASGGVDVQGLQALGTRLVPLAARANEELTALRRTPTGLTPPLVRTAVADAEAALEPVVEGLLRTSEGAQLAAGMLGADGPRRVLVALQNNAELRGTGGYVSTFATGQVDGGRLELQPFRDILDVHDPPGQTRTVPAPPEYVEDFGPFLADTTLWREWTMSPDVPDAASVTANVAGVLLGETPDVVLLLDVPALAAVVAVAQRDVRLPDGSTVSPDQLTEALLVDTYARAGTNLADQDARRSALRAAAGQTVTELLTDDVAPLAVVQELGRLARGRHLAVWSARADEQRQLEALGVAGSADSQGDDLALVSVNNLNANKLDYYVDRSVQVEATIAPDSVEVVQRVVLANRAPVDLVPYVAGEDTPGTVVERVELSISPQAQFRSLRQDGQPATGDVRPGVERTRVHTFVTLPRGGRVELELRYSVPLTDGRYRLRLLPQALANDAALDVVVSAADGLELGSVEGAELVGGQAVRQGPWAEREVVDVSLHQPEAGRWTRVREAVTRFLREPVTIGSR
jgi:hypothetical protein